MIVVVHPGQVGNGRAAVVGLKHVSRITLREHRGTLEPMTVESGLSSITKRTRKNISGMIAGCYNYGAPLSIHRGDHMAKRTRRLGPTMGDTLVFLAKTPFSSATDISVLTGEVRRQVAGRLDRLRKRGMVDCRTHATASLTWQKLHWVTTRGLRAAVRQGLMSEDEANRSAAITQSLSGRVDAAAVITRVATDMVNPFDTTGEIVHAPVRHPYDALIRVGRGWAAVFRQSLAQSRASLRKRIDDYTGDPGFTLILTPTVTDRRAIEDYVIRRGRTEVCVTAEGLIGASVLGASVLGATSWVIPGQAFIGIDRIVGLLPTCEPDVPNVRGRASPLRSIPRGFRYKTRVTRLLNALVDWPLVRKDDIMGILRFDGTELSRAVSQAGGLVESRRGFLRRDGDAVRLCLSPDGIKYVAGRDLVKGIDLLAALSLEEDPAYSTPYRGSRIRQWVRQSLHDDYVAATTGDIVRSVEPEWERYDVIPSPRSAMVLRPGNRRQAMVAAHHVSLWRQHTGNRPPRSLTENSSISFRPDAVVLLERDIGHPLYLLLEVERSARTPAALERRLEPYLIHSLLRPDESTVQFAPLWVFDSVVTEWSVWILMKKWREKSGRQHFIATSNVDLIREKGALGRVWRTQGRYIGLSTLDEAIESLDPPLDWRGS